MTDLLTAASKLEVSRERLRHALHRKASGSGSDAPGASGQVSAFRERLKTIPGANLVAETLGGWWAQHPLRLVGYVGVQGLTAVVARIARRRPLGLIVGALVIGGLLAWSRPWRWMLKSALFAGLVPRLLSKAVRHLPRTSWMSVLNALTRVLFSSGRRQQPGYGGRERPR